MFDDLYGIEETRSTTQWDKFSIILRRKFKRLSRCKNTTFNMIIANIKKQIETYDFKRIEFERRKSVKLNKELQILDKQIYDSIDLLMTELTLSILES